jgi:hypothetical protein
VLHGCYKGLTRVGVTRVLQRCYKGDTRVLQGLPNRLHWRVETIRVVAIAPVPSHDQGLHRATMCVLQGCYKSVTRMLQGCCKDVTSVPQGCYKDVARVLQACYKRVTSVLQVCYKCVTRDLGDAGSTLLVEGQTT